MTTMNESMRSAENTFLSKRSLLDTFFSSVRDPAFAVTYWDGTHVVYGRGEPEFTLDFRKEPGLLDLLASPSLFFGESYMRGEIDISGSFRAVANHLEQLERQLRSNLPQQVVDMLGQQAAYMN